MGARKIEVGIKDTEEKIKERRKEERNERRERGRQGGRYLFSLGDKGPLTILVM